MPFQIGGELLRYVIHQQLRSIDDDDRGSREREAGRTLSSSNERESANKADCTP